MSPSTIPSRAREYRLPQRTAFSDLTLVEADVPTPGPDEVLVKMHAGSLQFRDLMIAANMYPLPMKENVIPGSDAAGEVVAVGPTKWSDKSWTVGDRVAGQFSQLHLSGGVKSRAELGSGLGGGWDGVFTEYKIFPASGLVRIPDSLSYQEAATLPCAALTAYNCLFGSGSHVLVAGQWVLAQGTGGVSVFAAQFALSVGANIIITSSSDAKLEKVKALAGDRAHLLHTVNYKTHPDWDKEVLAITKGEGVDFIVEVGGQGTIEKSFSSIALGGMIGAIGFVAGDAKTPVPNVNGMALGHAATLRGILIGSRQQFEAMNNHITATGLKPLIDKVFEFEQLKEAYDYQWSQKHVGKVVIQISKQ